MDGLILIFFSICFLFYFRKGVKFSKNQEFDYTGLVTSVLFRQCIYRSESCTVIEISILGPSVSLNRFSCRNHVGQIHPSCKTEPKNQAEDSGLTVGQNAVSCGM